MLKAFAKLVGLQAKTIQPGYEIACGASCSNGFYEQYNCYSSTDCVYAGCIC